MIYSVYPTKDLNSSSVLDTNNRTEAFTAYYDGRGFVYNNRLQRWEN